MDYGIISPERIRSSSEFYKMELNKLEEWDPEFIVYSVDGRQVEVPQEQEFHDRINVDNFTTVFYVSQSVDRGTGQIVSEQIQKAIAIHLKDGCEEAKIPYKIILE